MLTWPGLLFFVNISQKKLVLSTKAAKNASRLNQFSRLFKEKIDDDRILCILPEPGGLEAFFATFVV